MTDVNLTPGETKSLIEARPHRWRKAPRSLFSTFICGVCGMVSMTKHHGRCPGRG